MKLSRDEVSKAGNIVWFGHYEQDNNLGNGSEEIEWIVLDAQDGRSLLISKYGLDAKPYNTPYVSVTWENCTLRNWLNNDFFKTAFTLKEQSAIITTMVENSESQGYSGYSTDDGNNTQDQIFLLSYHEAFNLYFRNNESRECVPTDYAVSQSAYTDNKSGSNGRWWLRSPGLHQSYASHVFDDGAHYCYHVDGISVCVRLALWINLESDVF